MKRMIQLSLCAVALILALACLRDAPAVAEGRTSLKTGACGESATYEFWKDDDGVVTLEISGSGPLDDVSGFRNSYMPRYIIVHEGITSICANAFSSLNSIYNAPVSIDIAGSVKTIGYQALWGCYVSRIILHEGLETIEDYGLNPGRHDHPVVLIPKSVKSIGQYALRAYYNRNLDGEYTPNIWVYLGSAAEQWCNDNDVDSYRVIENSLSVRESSMLRLCQAIDATRIVVPPRYREQAVAALGELNLTSSQMDSLTEYVNSESQVLFQAMREGYSLSISEITGFVSRFIDQMNKIGVGIQYEIAWYGRYPGVRLTATINGKARQYDIYRNTGNSWSFNYLAQSGSGFEYYETKDGLIVTSGYGTGAKGKELVIPATIDGKAVYGVQGYLGSSYETLTLSEGVRYIGAKAFTLSSNLTTLNLPSTLEFIGNGAFGSCAKLESVNIGPKLKYMGNAFVGTGVGVNSTVALPATLEHLGRGFDNMTIASGNPHFQITDGVVFETETHTLVYYPSNKTTTTYTVPSGTQVILNCGNAYTKEVRLPDSVRAIEPNAFENDTALTTVSLNEGLTYIGASAFAGCTALKNIDFPSTLTNLSAKALDGCAAITELTIDCPLTTLNYLGYMEKLNRITISVYLSRTDSMYWKSNYANPGAVTVYDTYSTGFYDRYRSWAETIGFAYARPEGASGDGEYTVKAFEFTRKTATITLGESITIDAIADITGQTSDGSAFITYKLSEGLCMNTHNSAWTSFTLVGTKAGTGTLQIVAYDKAVNGAYSEDRSRVLDTFTVTVKQPSATLTLPGDLKTIGAFAFAWARANCVIVPEGTTTIEAYAFLNCANLDVVVLPETLTSVAPTAFSGCGSFVVILNGDINLDLKNCKITTAWM